ncbi:MAG: bifunctional folylpolyglutamate synthase/dihydrofolate synthase [Chloroflexi bacterium]|nr:bifunctional folylpolyglutamate synthase/dihydrofolate synthase [Chloroflexota bacterium]
MNRTAYDAAVAYVESYISGPAEAPLPRDLDERERLQSERLPRMAALLELLGDPHRRFRSLHVAGTSGKGSTCAIAAAILRAAGLRVGLYTSPYLQTAAEKIEVDGHLIPPADLIKLVAEVRSLIESPTAPAAISPVAYTQLWAALTFRYFAQRQVDFAVVEVGMGGRYDYTNVLPSSAAAITNVGYDHLTALGPTLADIAHHKAGIIKPGLPAVTAATGEALEVIAAEARRLHAPLTPVAPGTTYDVRSLGHDGSVFAFRGQRWRFDDLRLGLLGAHQVANAAVALAMLESLEEQGVAISEAAVRQGLRVATIPGRLETVQGNPTVLLDGAHNPEKAQRLREALQALFPGRPIVMLLGCLASKEVDGMLSELVPLASLTVTTAPRVYFKPAVEPDDLASRCRALGGAAVAEDDPLTALDRACDAAAALGAIVCVTGSLYLVGQVRERWRPTDAILRDSAASR